MPMIEDANPRPPRGLWWENSVVRRLSGDAARKGADQVWKEVGEASKLATDPKDEPSRAGNVS